MNWIKTGGNTPLVPQMSGNTSPAGYSTSSSLGAHNTSNNAEWKAFDKNESTYYSSPSSAGANKHLTNPWLQINLPERKTVNKVIIVYPKRLYPASSWWVSTTGYIEASNDGILWTVIGQQALTITDQTVDTTFTINCSPTEQYSMYRIKTGTENAGYTNDGNTWYYLSLYEVQLYE